jgi:hypothetical protein
MAVSRATRDHKQKMTTNATEQDRSDILKRRGEGRNFTQQPEQVCLAICELGSAIDVELCAPAPQA